MGGAASFNAIHSRFLLNLCSAVRKIEKKARRAVSRAVAVLLAYKAMLKTTSEFQIELADSLLDCMHHVATNDYAGE